MIDQERIMEIRILHRQGVGVREIARPMGVSHNTVLRCRFRSTSEVANGALLVHSTLSCVEDAVLALPSRQIPSARCLT